MKRQIHKGGKRRVATVCEICGNPITYPKNKDTCRCRYCRQIVSVPKRRGEKGVIA